MKIVFLGTPRFAVPSLKILFNSSHEVRAVVTVPDCRQGRGLRVKYSPVKKAAQDLKLPVLQPENLNDEKFLNDLANFQADCFMVVGFCILPEVIFTMPPYGSINLHASRLPKYRGAAPIQWALIKGEKQTGVTTFFIQKKVDTGNILLQDSLNIEENDTAGTLHDKLSSLGADLVLRTIDLLEAGKISPRLQKGESSRAPKINTEMGKLNWEKSAEEIINLSRGLSPRPGVYTFWKKKRIKLFGAEKLNKSSSKEFPPGTIVDISPPGLDVTTGKGIVRFHQLQLEGKNRMDACEFIRGTHIAPGTKLD
ncbi:MAG: methionyl-tRNA formyltransferase [bacterium]